MPSYHDTNRLILEQEQDAIRSDFRKGKYGPRFGSFDQWAEAKDRAVDYDSRWSKQTCEACGGSGSDPGSVGEPEMCRACNGFGAILIEKSETETPRKQPGRVVELPKRESGAA